MKSIRFALLPIFAALLGACGAAPSSASSMEKSSFSSQKGDLSSFIPSSSQESQEPILHSSMPEIDLSSVDSSREEVASSETVSSSMQSQSEDRPVPGQGAWSLTSSALPKNPSSGTLQDITFTTTNGKGDTISFFGSSLRTGEGTKGLEKLSVANTIQVSKNAGFFYMTSGSASHLEFRIAHITGKDGSGTFDVTGVPSIYSANEMTADNGALVELSRKTTEDGLYYDYSCDLPAGRFRFANESNYAVYIYYLNNLA